MGNKVNKDTGRPTEGSEALSEWSMRARKVGGGTRSAEGEGRGDQARKASGYSKGEVQASKRWSNDRKAGRDHPAIWYVRKMGQYIGHQCVNLHLHFLVPHLQSHSILHWDFYFYVPKERLRYRWGRSREILNWDQVGDKGIQTRTVGEGSGFTTTRRWGMGSGVIREGTTCNSSWWRWGRGRGFSSANGTLLMTMLPLANGMTKNTSHGNTVTTTRWGSWGRRKRNSLRGIRRLIVRRLFWVKRTWDIPTWDTMMIQVEAATNMFVHYITNTGGKGSFTQWVHCGYIASSGAIRPHYTQWVHGGYFMKEPINLPTKNPVGGRVIVGKLQVFFQQIGNTCKVNQKTHKLWIYPSSLRVFWFTLRVFPICWKKTCSLPTMTRHKLFS